MAVKTKGSSKLTSKKRKELILDLCRALVVLESPREAADALTDLLTPKEIETIAKRLQIAEYLVNGMDYNSIREDLKVGYSTIARVNTWLNLSGEGFRIMLSRRSRRKEGPSLEERYDPYSWHNIKRRYSLYFWPQLILEEFMKRANKKEREKMQEVFEKMQLKRHEFSSEKNKQLYEFFSSNLGIRDKLRNQ